MLYNSIMEISIHRFKAKFLCAKPIVTNLIPDNLKLFLPNSFQEIEKNPKFLFFSSDRKLKMQNTFYGIAIVERKLSFTFFAITKLPVGRKNSESQNYEMDQLEHLIPNQYHSSLSISEILDSELLGPMKGLFISRANK